MQCGGAGRAGRELPWRVRAHRRHLHWGAHSGVAQLLQAVLVLLLLRRGACMSGMQLRDLLARTAAAAASRAAARRGTW